MSAELNLGFNYDPIALSLINSFWEPPQYNVPDVNQQSYYAPRYSPYTSSHKLSEPTYHHHYNSSQIFQPCEASHQQYVAYPYNFIPQYPIYYPVQSNFYQEAQYTENVQSKAVDWHSSNAESFCSVESHPDSQASLNTTITIVNTPLTEVCPIKISERKDEEMHVTIDEKALKEVLEIIDITSPTTTPSKKAPLKTSRKLAPYKPPNTEDETRKYICTACDKYFINRPGLRKHFKTQVHKNFVEERGIKDPVHDPTTWTIGGEHRCFVCKRAFAKYTDMIDHVVSH